MRNYRIGELNQGLLEIVGHNNVLTNEYETRAYRTGIRVGYGCACAVVIPRSLVELWRVLKLCVSLDKIIIIQAANTGLTGGSTPDGDDYDRDVVIINTLKLDKLTLLERGEQVLAFPGSTLYKLEEILLPIGRGPHSVIGSSCIGASVVGGVCNNSGGNLVNRGPAYTELSLYARLTSDGKLELVNHLGIFLGTTEEEILDNLEKCNFQTENLPETEYLASDDQYRIRVRDVQASTPARYNADKRRLYESSGCAGKLAVFAVRLNTFPRPKKEQVFFIGTNHPEKLSELRKRILSDLSSLPDMGEYMHRSYFDAADKYCKDTFFLIKYFGPSILPKLFKLKRRIDLVFSRLFFNQSTISDKILQFIGRLLPDQLPRSFRDYRDRFEHYMIIMSSDLVIHDIRKLLSEHFNQSDLVDYFECTESEGKDILLHRYVAGSAPARCKIVNASDSGEILPLDVALPRNCDNWHEIFPEDIISQMADSFKMGHFLCMVFHWDFVLKKGVDLNCLKSRILKILDSQGAKYPAEHNVGHIYKADKDMASFHRKLDPTNSFNSGLGKTSKKRNYA